MLLHKTVVIFYLLMSSLLKISSFVSRFGGRLSNKGNHGLIIGHHFGTEKMPWERDNNEKQGSNRFKRPTELSDFLSRDRGGERGGRFASSRSTSSPRRDSEKSSRDESVTDHNGRDRNPSRDYRTMSGSDRQSRDTRSYRSDSQSRDTRSYRSDSQSRDSWSERSDTTRRVDKSNVDEKHARVDYDSRRGAYDNDRRSAPRSEYGGYSSYPDRSSRPQYGREEGTEPIYGYYEGDHLYGITSVRLALANGRREIKELLVQEGIDPANKKDSRAAQQILDLAKKNNIQVREFSKHDLNMMSDNRPHQGFVLRAQPLNFTSVTALEPVSNYRYNIAFVSCPIKTKMLF